MTRTVFRNVNVLDGLAAAGKADVIVEAERITEVRYLPNPTPLRDDDVVYDVTHPERVVPVLPEGLSSLTYGG